MDENLKRNKQTIRAFMREHYTDAKLVELLGHARSGQLGYGSCCCLIGIPNATHELQDASGIMLLQERGVDTTHYNRAKRVEGACEAESAFYKLPADPRDPNSDEHRRRRLIPIILAEIRRRESARQVPPRAARSAPVVAG